MLNIINNNRLLNPESLDLIKDYIINQNQQFLSYMKRNNLKETFNYTDYTYQLENEIYPSLTDAMVNPHDNRITFYGQEGIKYIIHEWVHLTFPSYNCSRHAEGLANYINNSINTHLTHEMSLLKSQKIINFTQLCIGRNPEELFTFITTGHNFYDSRFGNNILARATGNLFVKYLIDKYGLNEYMELFYKKINNESQTTDIEEKEFLLFYESLNFIAIPVNVKNTFTEQNDRIQDKLTAYGFPETGSAIKHLFNNKDKISKNDFDKLKNMILINRLENQRLMCSLE